MEGKEEWYGTLKKLLPCHKLDPREEGKKGNKCGQVLHLNKVWSDVGHGEGKHRSK